MREIRLEEWKRRRENQPRLSKEFGEWSRTTVRRRPTSEEELTNSILYIKSKNEELIDKKILVPVAFRQWKLRLK